MKFPGYWVSVDSSKAVLERVVFDETELDPATNWKQAWQNQDGKAERKGYVDLESALWGAAQILSAAEGGNLGEAEKGLATRFSPKWVGDRCEIESLSCLLNSIVGGEST